MKIIILLFALATIATAVPANHYEALPRKEENLPVTIREKKSPQHEHHAAGLSPESGTEDIHTQSTKSGQKISSTPEGRSLGFKKPIIVKKKIGYHLYRDSDEEMAHADPHENCSQQVKVKLCDDETGSPKSECLTSERLNEHITDKEIENSIKTAKEAVENLQRGFHKLELSSAKLATMEDKELEDDLALHQHIEAARKALEHVQQNFEHLDSMNLQATSPKTEAFQTDVKVSDEERLAQWKDAIDNIQKNFEIARNIEDAFKADSEHANLHFTQKDGLSKIRESDHTESNVDSLQKSNTDQLSNVELRSDGSDALTKPEENSDVDMFTAPTQQKELSVKLHSDSLRSEKVTEDLLTDHETKTTNIEKSNEHLSVMKDSEITLPSDDQQLKSANVINLDDNDKLKTLESDTHETKLQTEKDAMPEIENMTPLMKDISVNKDNPLAKSAHKESIDLTTKQREHDMSMEASDVSKHHSQVEMKHSDDHESEKNPHKEDSVKIMSLTDKHPLDASLKLKSVHEVDENHREEKMESTNSNHKFHEHMIIPVPTPENIKHIESTPIRETGLNNELQNHNEHSFMRMTEDQNTEHKSNEMHTVNEHPNNDMRLTEEQKYHAFLMRWANENQQRFQEADLTRPTKMGDFNNGQHFHDLTPNIRLNQVQNTEHHLSENHEQDLLALNWAHENQQNPLQIAKTATGFHDTMKMNKPQNMQNHATDDHNLHENFLMRLAQEKQLNEHLKTTPEFNNGHLHEIFPQNRFGNNLANARDMSQVGPTMHEHTMKHVMTSDMDSSMQPSMHMSMRDSIGKPTTAHNDMHWNHHHHAMARYGSGLPVTSASSGAVGIFPNANTGGCGIPLMLSCSPNVISGTLAKAQPHPGTITAPAYRSDDDLVYYMKRDVKDTDELPTLKIQKMTIPFNHKPELVFDKTQ